VNVIGAIDDIGFGDQLGKQRDRGVDAVDHEFAQRALQAHQAFVAVACVDDQLADQAVIVSWNLIADINTRIDANTQTARRVIGSDFTG